MWNTREGSHGSDRSQDLGQPGQSSTKTYCLKEMTKAKRSEKTLSADAPEFKPASYYQALRDQRQKDLKYIEGIPNFVKELCENELTEGRIEKLRETYDEIKAIESRVSQQHSELTSFNNDDQKEITVLNDNLYKSSRIFLDEKYKPKRYTEQHLKSQIQKLF